VSAAEPTRSATAQDPIAAAAVARRRRAQPSGWWGMALFLCGEVTLFGTLIATYFYLDFNSRHWPPPGIERPSVILPFVATGSLLVTTIPMWLAVRASRAGRRGAVVWLIASATVIQACYLALQIILMAHDSGHFSPQGSAYGSIYFTLLGLHHAHVLLGILIDLAVLWYVALRGLTNYWLISVRTAALYWYVVAGVAVFVVFTQTSPTL
jgi:heme/copper-type cytochrome/quinol oxidase subunit 3